MKAFKEGKQPVPGPPGGDESINASSPGGLSPAIAPTAPPTSTSQSGNNSHGNEKSIPVYRPPASSGPVNLSNMNISDGEELDDEDVGYSEVDRKSISAAGKHAKFAMSALLYDDIRTAIQNLEQALAILNPIKIIEDLQ